MEAEEPDTSMCHTEEEIAGVKLADDQDETDGLIADLLDGGGLSPSVNPLMHDRSPRTSSRG